ncbi:LIC_10190 family membrane protein [Larkinella terrae]|uniref:DUF8201 domain-containing protein n=1 Tax=Larkinella terrae TaxID=2025311 RepID=A0A7K0EM56_9BACT|nr:hypothetical protein [Larkinella terrae]MRS62566.1 hypothetical protein [Larkinella terrae]
MILLILWAVLASGCSIYGLLIFKLLVRWRIIDDSEAVRGSDLLLAGLVLLVLFVQLASIFWPANYVLASSWLAGALILAVFSPSITRSYFRRFALQQKQIPVFWLIFLVVLLYSTLEPVNADSGLYHLPSIRWYERFRVIPGLGNLHGRLAFNSSFLVASAAFGLTDLAGQTVFPLNGFVFLVVSWRLLGQIRSATSIRFLALLLLILVLFYLVRQVYSPTPDVWATLLPITIFMIWLDIKPVFSFRHILLFMLVCLCITVKLATIPIAFCLLPLGWAVRKQLSSRTLVFLTGMAFLLIAPWLIRTTILSGYLLYPFPAIDLFAFDWKIPLERVQFEKDYVTIWGRFRLFEPEIKPGLLEKPATEWIPMWWSLKPYYFLNKPTWVLAVLSPFVIGLHFLNPIRRARIQKLLWPWLVALIGFLFWFFSAPDYRFGYQFIWLTAFLPLLPFMPQRSDFWNVRPFSNLVVTGLLLILLSVYANTFLRKEHFPLLHYAIFPKPLSFRHRGPEEVVFDRCRTRSGLEVLIPNHGPLFLGCYDQERPCSPYFYPDLELRGNTIADGFRSTLSTGK